VSITIGGASSDFHGGYDSTCTGEDVKWLMSKDLDRRYLVSASAMTSSSACPIGGAMNRLLSRKDDNLGDLGGTASARHTIR